MEIQTLSCKKMHRKKLFAKWPIICKILSILSTSQCINIATNEINFKVKISVLGMNGLITTLCSICHKICSYWDFDLLFSDHRLIKCLHTSEVIRRVSRCVSMAGLLYSKTSYSDKIFFSNFKSIHNHCKLFIRKFPFILNSQMLSDLYRMSISNLKYDFNSLWPCAALSVACSASSVCETTLAHQLLPMLIT